jgi:hypothetical protein
MNLKKLSNHSLMILTLPFIVILIWGIGYRPIYVGSDTIVYTEYYNISIYLGKIGAFHSDFLFDKMTQLFFKYDFSVQILFSVICAINFLIIYLLTQQINKYIYSPISNYYLFLLFMICFFFSPFFFATQANVIRQGVAIFAEFLFFISILNRSAFIILLFSSLIALGFHKVSIIYLGFSFLLFLPYFHVLTLVFFLALGYCSGLTKVIISVLADFFSFNTENIFNYGLDQGYLPAIRIDFTLFTIFMGLCFHVLSKLTLPEKNLIKFKQLIKVYWILTMPFFLFGFAAFSDRYLLPAWVFLSVLSGVYLAFTITKTTFPKQSLFFIFLMAFIYFFCFTQGLF